MNIYPIYFILEIILIKLNQELNDSKIRTSILLFLSTYTCSNVKKEKFKKNQNLCHFEFPIITFPLTAIQILIQMHIQICLNDVNKKIQKIFPEKGFASIIHSTEQ